MATTVLKFVFIGSPGILLIANAKPRPRSWMAEANNSEPNKLYLDSRPWMQSINQTADKLQDWAYGTGERLKIVSISTLALGSVALVMLISLIMHEDDWVANIVAKVPKKENEAVDKEKKKKKENREDRENKEDKEHQEEKGDKEEEEDKGEIVDRENKEDKEVKEEKEEKENKEEKEDKEEEKEKEDNEEKVDKEAKVPGQLNQL